MRTLTLCSSSLLALSLFAACASSPPSPTTRPPAVESRLPIVLVHGIAGFPWSSGIPYFKGLPEALHARGDHVVTAALPPYDDDPVRSSFLARAIDDVLRETGAARVHVIAHSQGGLDARHLVEHTEYARHIATVTTISTPHHGTPIADLAYDLLPNVLLDATLGAHALVIGEPSDVEFTPADGSAAVFALTSEARRARNTHVDDEVWRRTPLFSFAGVTGGGGDALCATGHFGGLTVESAPQASLVPTWATIALFGDDGPLANDGLVPAESAAFGHFLGCLPGDHMELMGHGGLAFRGEGTVELDFVTFFTGYVERLHAVVATGDVRAMLDAPPPGVPTLEGRDVRFARVLEGARSEAH